MEAINKLVSKFGEMVQVGLDPEDGRVAPYHASTHNLKDGGEISALLPYRDYDAESQLFVNKNSYGFFIEISPLTGANDDIVKQLTGVFATRMPEKSSCGIYEWISGKVGNSLDEYLAARQNAMPVIKRMSENRVKFLKTGIKDSLFKNFTYFLRDYRIFVGVSKEGKPKPSDVENMIAVRESMISGLKQIGVYSIICDKERFASYLQELTTPDNSPYRPEVAVGQEDIEHEPLHHLCVGAGAKIRQNKASMIFNEGTEDAVEVRNYLVKRRPKTWAQWQNQQLIGDFFNDGLRLTCPTLFSTVFYIPDQEEENDKTTAKVITTNKKAEERGALQNLLPSTQDQAAQWNFVKKHTDEGSKIVRAIQNITLYAPSGRATTAESSLKGVFDAAGWVIKKDWFLQLQTWMIGLPFFMSEGLYSDLTRLGRMKTFLSYNIANIAPLQGELKGSAPLYQYCGRRGQPVGLNNFDNPDGNFNIAVVGKSGSGKTVQMNEITKSILGIGGRDITIDIGGGYKHTCELFGGEYIELDDDLSLNPFTGIGPSTDASPEEVGEYWFDVKSMITSIVISMCRQKQDIDDYEESLIIDFVGFCIDTYKEQCSFTKIRDAMLIYLEKKGATLQSENKAIIERLAYTMSPYCEGGAFDKYFNRPCNIDFSSHYVVLETEKLASSDRFRQVAIKILMYHITENLYNGDRKTPTAIKIDEGWKMLEGRDSRFIEDVSRRARKYMGALVTGTQSILDYNKNPAAKAVLENSDFVFLMSQKASSIDALRDTKVVKMDEQMERLLKSIHRNGELYSEVFIVGPNEMQILGRLILDPFSSAAYTSKGPDYTRISELQKQHGSVHAGIEAFLRERGLEEYAA